MKIWKFGIVGAGLIADFHAKAINEMPNAKLIAVCDVLKDKAEKMAQQYNCSAYGEYRKMFESADIDIVTIATPSGNHMEPAIEAAKAGKHVLCEKPLDVTLERIDKMIEAHDKAGTALGSIFPCRYLDILPYLKNAISNNRFGKITYVGLHLPFWRSDDYYGDGWHGTWKLDGGGALMNQSIHFIDMLCAVMPPVKQLYAFTDKLAHPMMEAEDTAVSILKFENNTLGIIYGTTASFPGQVRRFEITGNRGTVIIKGDAFDVWKFENETPEDDQIRHKFSQGKPDSSFGVSDPAAIEHKRHKMNFEDFVNSLEKGQKFHLDGREGRKAVELILRIYNQSG